MGDVSTTEAIFLFCTYHNGNDGPCLSINQSSHERWHILILDGMRVGVVDGR